MGNQRSTFPYRIDCAADSIAELCDWAAANTAQIDRLLRTVGAVLFTESDVRTPAQFEQLVRAVATDLTHYQEESSPRTRIAGSVFSSTDYPPEYPIQFHNEFSYASRWPKQLYFGCFRAAPEGGETPLADTRRVLANMDTALRRRFEKTGVLYVRNYRPKVGVSWQRAFGTHDHREVEAICAASGISCEWRKGDVLNTRQRSSAIVLHPDTCEPVWFNHAFHFSVHAVEPLELRQLLEEYPADDPLSTNSLFGDGTPLNQDIIEEIRTLYQRSATSTPWHEGDVLLIDNMLTAHARAPFYGERSIGVLMSHPCQRDSLPEMLAI